jgi:hypothetical protein
VRFDFGPPSPDIYGMAKRMRMRKQVPLPWAVIQITRTPARFIGIVYAADEQAAKATAIEQFEIRNRMSKESSWCGRSGDRHALPCLR